MYICAVRLKIGLVNDVYAEFITELEEIRIRWVVRHAYRVDVVFPAQLHIPLKLFRSHGISVLGIGVMVIYAVQFYEAVIYKELIAPYLYIPESHALLHAAAFDLIVHVVEHRSLVAPFDRHEISECELRPLIG